VTLTVQRFMRQQTQKAAVFCGIAVVKNGEDIGHFGDILITVAVTGRFSVSFLPHCGCHAIALSPPCARTSFAENILALDLGKYKSVACIHRWSSEDLITQSLMVVGVFWKNRIYTPNCRGDDFTGFKSPPLPDSYLLLPGASHRHNACRSVTSVAMLTNCLD
jgi:hypothetical protein